MRRSLHALGGVVLVALVAVATLGGQTSPLTISGTLRAGQPGETPYTLIKPDSWNGTLVVDLDFVTSWNPAQRQWFLDHGYAIGGTQRTQDDTAYRIRDYVDNFISIRKTLTDRAGAAPRRTIVFGVSRGAIPGRAALELQPDVFDGAVVFSGGGQALVGLLLSKLDAVWTVKTLVNPRSPLTLVNLPKPPSKEYDHAFDELLNVAKSTPQGRARLALALAFDQAPTWSVRGKPQPGPTEYDAQLDQMIANFGSFYGPRWQIETVAGGNPSWNHGVDYRDLLARSGLSDLVRDQYQKAGLTLDADLETLAKAPRVSADPAAVAVAERYVGYTGKIKAPILSAKTIGDPADAPSADTAYTQTLQRAGTRDLLRNVYIKRPGHATMSVIEKITAFQVLVDRLDSGRWDSEAALPARMNTLAAEIAKASTLSLGESTFMLFQPAPALRTWDFTNWGTYRPAGSAATGR